MKIRLYIGILCAFLSLGVLFNLYVRFEYNEPLKIAITPWPGFEPLYLAEQKGYLDELGLDIEFVEMDTLADILIKYEQGEVDGMFATIGEILQVYVDSGKISKVVMITDYSNGADMILSNRQYRNIPDLKGRRIGVESSHWALYMLSFVLKNYNMSLEDVNLIRMEQPYMKEKLLSGEVDAIVTYVPYSWSILEDDNVSKLFDSSEAPGEFMALLALSEESVEKHKEQLHLFLKGWDMALKAINDNPEESIQIMAKREGVTPKQYRKSMKISKLLNSDEQRKIMMSGKLKQKFNQNIEIIYGSIVAKSFLPIEDYITSADVLFKESE